MDILYAVILILILPTVTCYYNNNIIAKCDISDTRNLTPEPHMYCFTFNKMIMEIFDLTLEGKNSSTPMVPGTFVCLIKYRLRNRNQNLSVEQYVSSR